MVREYPCNATTLNPVTEQSLEVAIPPQLWPVNVLLVARAEPIFGPPEDRLPDEVVSSKKEKGILLPDLAVPQGGRGWTLPQGDLEHLHTPDPALIPIHILPELAPGVSLRMDGGQGGRWLDLSPVRPGPYGDPSTAVGSSASSGWPGTGDSGEDPDLPDPPTPPPPDCTYPEAVITFEDLSMEAEAAYFNTSPENIIPCCNGTAINDSWFYDERKPPTPCSPDFGQFPPPPEQYYTCTSCEPNAKFLEQMRQGYVSYDDWAGTHMPPCASLIGVEIYRKNYDKIGRYRGKYIYRNNMGAPAHYNDCHVRACFQSFV